jgi:7-cyano-7-deazaguanine synthase in queuosine biosynthesis
MKALVLFSGGLDSIIAVKIAQEAGLEVEAIHFVNPFHQHAEKHLQKVIETARRLQIQLHCSSAWSNTRPETGTAVEPGANSPGAKASAVYAETSSRICARRRCALSFTVRLP